MLRKLLLVILLLPAAGRVAAQAGPDKKVAEDSTLVVVKFSWKFDLRRRAARPANPAVSDLPSAAPASTTGTTASSRRRGGEATIEDQSADMQRVEMRARRPRAPAAEVFYRYKVTLSNTDARAVRAFYWSYETRQSLRPDDVSRRQFFCAVKINPGKSREIKADTAKAPSLVVGADVLASDAESHEKVMINRVEYADGTIWQRPDWSPAGGAAPPPDATTLTRVRGCVELRPPARR